MKYMMMILALFLGTMSVQAHFIVDAQNRDIFLLKAENGDTRVVMRSPLTLAYANELSQRSSGAHFTGPFMISELVGGRTYYRLDNDRVISEHVEFANFLLRDFRFSVNGNYVKPQHPEFIVVNTYGEASETEVLGAGINASLEMLDTYVPDFPDKSYISDSMVVISFFLPEVQSTDPIKIELLSAAFPVPEDTFFETSITDLRDGSATLFNFSGTGFDPVIVSGSALTSFVHFVQQGMYHIITGYDHVLFVLCLVIAATSFHLLVWAVTGFTLGHSLTLAAGAFGFVPHSAWFIPMIELLVAASIVLMGVLILLRKSDQMNFWLAAALGLLHGFGFSFMLADMLGGTGGALIVALAGFNIGVELGQLAIVAVSFLALMLIAKFSIRTDRYIRYGGAAFATIVAVTMMYERSGLLMESLT